MWFVGHLLVLSLQLAPRNPLPSPRVHRAPTCCAIPISISVAVALENGESELVTLSSDEDPQRVAADLATRYDLAPEQVEALAADLAEQWADGCAAAPDIYVYACCDSNPGLASSLPAVAHPVFEPSCGQRPNA